MVPAGSVGSVQRRAVAVADVVVVDGGGKGGGAGERLVVTFRAAPEQRVGGAVALGVGSYGDGWWVAAEAAVVGLCGMSFALGEGLR